MSIRIKYPLLEYPKILNVMVGPEGFLSNLRQQPKLNDLCTFICCSEYCHVGHLIGPGCFHVLFHIGLIRLLKSHSGEGIHDLPKIIDQGPQSSWDLPSSDNKGFRSIIDEIFLFSCLVGTCLSLLIITIDLLFFLRLLALINLS